MATKTVILPPPKWLSLKKKLFARSLISGQFIYTNYYRQTHYFHNRQEPAVFDDLLHHQINKRTYYQDRKSIRCSYVRTWVNPGTDKCKYYIR